MTEDRTDHTFTECPECGGTLSYPTKADVLCSDCEAEFTHEIRADRHLLWSFDGDYRLDEVVARGGVRP